MNTSGSFPVLVIGGGCAGGANLIFVRASVPEEAASSAALSLAAAGLPSCTSAFSGVLFCSHTALRT